jgi:DNA-binding beta-propeller fold protein YncE
MLNRATNIAVDGAGNIYVGDREGGRVQVFDPSGKFVTLWTVGNSKSILYGLAADRAGNVYASTEGSIERHEGASGKLVSTLQYSGGNKFESIASTPDGGLVAMWYQEHPGVLNSREGVEGDLVQFDSLGKVTRVITSVVSDQTDGPERDLHLAVDGTGSIYAASSYSSAVFKFSREGKYLLRFGSRGDLSKPNQFSLGTLAVAIDGAGRAFVVNNDRILVFDPSGQYLDSFGIGGSAYGIAINEKDQIYLVKGSQVAVFALSDR